MPYFLSAKVIFGKGTFKRLSLELEGRGSRASLCWMLHRPDPVDPERNRRTFKLEGCLH